VNSLRQIVKKINFLKVAQWLVVVLVLVAPVALVFAQFTKIDCPTGINCSNTTSVSGLIRMVINWLLGIAFGIAVLFLIIGGFWYITSAGNEETAEKGKKTAVNAIIGIVIIILSYVIVNVVSNLVASSGGGGTP
jgi:uncharacterized membrane protein YwzB